MCGDEKYVFFVPARARGGGGGGGGGSLGTRLNTFFRPTGSWSLCPHVFSHLLTKRTNNKLVIGLAGSRAMGVSLGHGQHRVRMHAHSYTESMYFLWYEPVLSCDSLLCN